MQESRELRDLMLGLYRDFEADRTNVDFFSDHAGAVVIATDPREWWEGGAEIRAIVRRQSEELGSVVVKPGRLKAFVEGSVGWVHDDPVFTYADGTSSPRRITVVLHREGGAWKVVQWHQSIGITNESFGREVTTSIEAVADLVTEERPDLRRVGSSDGTITIMFTDIESSTAVNESMGDDRWITLLNEHSRLLRDHVDAAGGSIVKSQGDGFMLAFGSARRAVECAIALQRRLAEIYSPDTPVRVRMGVHTGEPVREADDFHGRDVAYAARVASAAAGGEILVSSLVKSLIEPWRTLEFDGPRELEFKGFEGRQHVFAVKWS